jgi:hypothetical protein
MACCSVDGCENGVFATGMCSKHYNRKRKTGTTDNGPRARSSLEQRFWKYVDRRGIDECWPWTGTGSNGYGTIGPGGRRASKVPAHRVSWEIHNGPIPIVDDAGSHGIVVRHKCNNRLCVNPSHLRLGTQADNVKDMWVNKGAPRGNARLTESQIASIRDDPRSSRQLAPIYGVSDAHIRSIRSGRCWTPERKPKPK